MERDLLIQRWQDGRLGAAQAAAAARLVADDPALAEQVRLQDQLNDQLKELASPLRAEDPRLLADRILTRLPARAPAAHLSLSLFDLIAVVVILAFGAGTYALAGVSLSHSTALGWIAGVSVLLGLAIVVLPQFFRSAEAGFWASLLHHPVATTRSDLLVVRCLGLVVMGGGLWLLVGA